MYYQIKIYTIKYRAINNLTSLLFENKLLFLL